MCCSCLTVMKQEDLDWKAVNCGFCNRFVHLECHKKDTPCVLQRLSEAEAEAGKAKAELADWRREVEARRAQEAAPAAKTAAPKPPPPPLPAETAEAPPAAPPPNKAAQPAQPSPPDAGDAWAEWRNKNAPPQMTADPKAEKEKDPSSSGMGARIHRPLDAGPEGVSFPASKPAAPTTSLLLLRLLANHLQDNPAALAALSPMRC